MSSIAYWLSDADPRKAGFFQHKGWKNIFTHPWLQTAIAHVKASRFEVATRLSGVCERAFRRYLDRYEEGGLDGRIDKRYSQVSQRRAPQQEDGLSFSAVVL